jgi:hypothetical protein
VYSRTRDLLIASRITYDEIQAGTRLADLAASSGT